MSVDLIPNGATRVQVKDEVGKIVWRKPSDIRQTDMIQYNPNTGDPYVMYGSSGRPTISSNKPSQPLPTATINKIVDNKKSSLTKDSVYSSTKNNPDSSDVLTSVLIGLAEESASLAFERQEAERKGEKTSQISLRRVNALRAVGDTWLKKKELMANNSVDLESQAFKIVFTHIAETFRKACDNAGVRPEMSESVFATFGEMVDDVDWVKEVQNKIEKGT
jgi:hypothetical protein